MEVFADLPDDSGEGGPQQLLHVVRPRAIPAVRLQVVDPLGAKRETRLSAGTFRRNLGRTSVNLRRGLKRILVFVIVAGRSAAPGWR